MSCAAQKLPYTCMNINAWIVWCWFFIGEAVCTPGFLPLSFLCCCCVRSLSQTARVVAVKCHYGWRELAFWPEVEGWLVKLKGRQPHLSENHNSISFFFHQRGGQLGRFDKRWMRAKRKKKGVGVVEDLTESVPFHLRGFVSGRKGSRVDNI